MIVNVPQTAENKETTEVRVWDLAAGRLALTVPQTSPTFAVAFSPNGQRMAVGGWNQQCASTKRSAARNCSRCRSNMAIRCQLLTFSPDGAPFSGCLRSHGRHGLPHPPLGRHAARCSANESEREAEVTPQQHHPLPSNLRPSGEDLLEKGRTACSASRQGGRGSI